MQGTGPGGRIVARDLAAAPEAPAPPSTTGSAPRSSPNIAASWQQIPHVHIGGELAADGIVRARASAPTDLGVTVTDLLVVALARALAEVPELNALRRADGSVARSDAVHLSLAVATPGGVVAPVLRDAGSLSLAEVARERSRLVEAARAGTLDGRELAGGTITLSNLGAHPVDFFAPVVSGPQVAMVATGRVADRPVAVDGLVGVRPTMWVERRDRPPRSRRRGGRPPARRARTPARPAPRRPRMTIAPVPVDEAVPGERPDGAGDDSLLALYREMVRVRAFEEEVIEAFNAGLIPGSTHPASAPRGSRPARSRRCGPTTSSSRPTAATARR